jgi:transmembrane sensor
MEEIVIRTLQGIARPDELESLERWRAAEPENERTYRQLVRLWDATLRGARPAPRSEPPSSFEIIRTARIRESEARRSAAEERGGLGRWGRRVAAAIALVAAGLVGSLVEGPKPLMAGGLISTSAVEMATVTLPDGTVVRIGPSSQVRLPSEAAQREVWLEGEAFFSVAAPDDRPFVVHTGSGSARAMETRFQVRTADDGMRIGVLEGRVAVSAEAGEGEVMGGEVGEVAGGRLTVTTAEAAEDLRPKLGNFLAFRSTPLTTVLQEVSGHFELSAEVLDAELGTRTVTASFNDATFGEVMSVVCRITASRCTITDSTAVVVGAGVQ